ncbi:NAD(P)H-hydrate dehydratase [Vreelandella aquamarina]|uniref:NAD(P)H-hydrate dehydratase n=1 Tax=Vreelandella aquamarina TaxID=77097 RepID=UPI00384EBF88
MSTLSTSSLRPLYKAAQVRELDRRTIAGGIESFALMQRAASSAWHSFRSRWPQARSVTVLCGGGNNGGDGHVLAALAMQSGLKVQRLSLKPLEALTGDVARAAELATAAGVGFEEWQSDTTLVGEVVVDALLGTGLSGEVAGSIQQAIKAINASARPVLALDIPSGISADTGAVLGMAVAATCTVTFIGDKMGLHTGDAPAYTGEIDFRPLGVKAQAFFDIPPTAWRLDDSLLGETFTPRSRTSHKGSLGHVLVMGGAPGFGGAALLASQAAARLGAGKVTLATACEHVTASLVRCPEVMVRGVRGGADRAALPAQADAVVVGPGLGQDAWGQAILQSALHSSSPLVVDADALNLLASRWPELRRDDWILTPHPGEAARLLGCSVADVQADRPEAVRALQRARGGIVVLKGAGSLVAGPSGLVVCPYGNPGMASGGMGDVLSGMLGALVGQFGSLEQSAWLGVMVHALAGDEAAKTEGERGLLASDLASYARVLINP